MDYMKKSIMQKRDNIETILAESWNAQCIWVHLKGDIYGYGRYWLPDYLEQQKSKSIN